MRRLRSLVLAVLIASLIAVTGGAVESVVHASTQTAHVVAESTWG